MDDERVQKPIRALPTQAATWAEAARAADMSFNAWACEALDAAAANEAQAATEVIEALEERETVHDDHFKPDFKKGGKAWPR
jgi:hypothetical protein